MIDSAKLKVDKTQFSVGKLEDQGDEIKYWKDKTPHERLEALETIRQIIYGYYSTPPRLHRVLEVVEFPSS